MHKNFIQLIFLLLPVLCFPLTYYVSPVGNNVNSGLSPGAAFLTLQHASDVVASGDSVIVLAGTYTGFYHTTSGTPSQRIVFSAQPGVLINAPNGSTSDGINLEGASYITIEGFKAFGLPRAGFRAVLDTGIIFRGNAADSCGKWGIFTGFSENILIENNECSRSRDEHGIYISNSADNAVLRGNHCWGNRACGIHMNGDISQQPGDGIISNVLIEYNIIHDNGNGGGSGINGDGVQYSLIQNNLLYENHASGISLYMIDAAEGAAYNVVVNNTIVQPAVTRWALNITNGSTNNTAFNNIFYSDHSFRGSITIDTSSLEGFKSDYNVLADRMSANDNDVITLAQWQQTTQLDSHSVISTLNALFINANTHDYHLPSTSPARDLGKAFYNSVAAPANDFDFVSRPQGLSHDAGAYEYGTITDIEEILSNRIRWSDLSFDAEVCLYDMAGRLFLRDRKRAIENNLASIQNGLFIFTVLDEKSKVSGGWLKIMR